MRKIIVSGIAAALFLTAAAVDAQDFVVYKGKQVIQQYKKAVGSNNYEKVKAKMTVETYVVFDLNAAKALDTSDVKPQRIVVMKAPVGSNIAQKKIQLSPYVTVDDEVRECSFDYYTPDVYTFIKPYEPYFGEWLVNAKGGAAYKTFTILESYDREATPEFGLGENYVGEIKSNTLFVPTYLNGVFSYFEEESEDLSSLTGMDTKSKFTFDKKASAVVSAPGISIDQAVAAVSNYLYNGGKGYIATMTPAQ